MQVKIFQLSDIMVSYVYCWTDNWQHRNLHSASTDHSLSASCYCVNISYLQSEELLRIFTCIITLLSDLLGINKLEKSFNIHPDEYISGVFWLRVLWELDQCSDVWPISLKSVCWSNKTLKISHPWCILLRILSWGHQS